MPAIEISVNEASLSFGLKFRALVDPSTGSISDKEQASVAAQEIITALGQRFMDTNAVCLYCDDSAFARFSLAFGQGRLLALAPAESALSLAGWYVFPDAGSTSITRRLLASLAEPVKTATATRKLKVFGLGSNAFSLADRLSSVTNTARAPSYYLAKTLVAAIQTDLALGSGRLPGSGVVEGFLLASLEMKSVMRGELGPAIDTMRSAFIEALPGDVRRAAQAHDAYDRKYLNQKGGRDLGNLNPLLYRVAGGSRLPAFRDIVLGGNAVANAGPGYDLVTGLGTPDVDNLVRNILVLQKLRP